MFDIPNDNAIRLCRDVLSKLKPGEKIKVAGILIDQASLDFVLDGIAGSAYEYGYLKPWTRPDLFKDWLLFRLEKPLNDGRRTYVSPDRRHLFDLDTFAGIYSPRQSTEKPTPCQTTHT